MPLIEEYQQTGHWLFQRRGYLPVFLVLAGAGVLFLIEVHDPPFHYKLICLLVSLAGMIVRGITIAHTPKHTSGRNTRRQKAHVLNTTGIYSTVRHPLYLGNSFIWLGLAMFPGNVWFVLVSILVFWIYYERIMFAEEGFLLEKFGQDYSDWASQTPAFIPSLKKYTRPALPFSFKNILKREYNGLGNTVLTFTIIELVRSSLIHQKLFLEKGWIIFFSAGFFIWLLIRTIEKYTRTFEVEGR